MKVLSVFGTRPEGIKMCPLIKELEKREEIDSVVCSTGQHKEMLDQVLDVFGVVVDYSLDIMRTQQTLYTITTDLLEKIQTVLSSEKPDIVLVHGDTSTSFVAALASFYSQIPVGHVEAGLRTNDKYSPFPEEMNRTLTARIAELHFAPTKLNQDNLHKENINKNIFVTGNTVIDAFETTVRKNYIYREEELNRILAIENRRIVLLTAHRRENLGQPLENICNAIKRLTESVEDIEIVYLVHKNPKVRNTVNSILKDVDRIHLVEPVDVQDMHNLMSEAYLTLTDSGGLQEEVPHFGVPVLVLRTETERPEAVEAGTVKVVGVEEQEIFDSAYELLSNKEKYLMMAKSVNPYGDGQASKRITDLLIEWNKKNKAEIG